jgi:hypothetical protein
MVFLGVTGMKHIKNLGFLLYVARSAEELERLSGKSTEYVNFLFVKPMIRIPSPNTLDSRHCCCTQYSVL